LLATQIWLSMLWPMRESVLRALRIIRGGSLCATVRSLAELRNFSAASRYVWVAHASRVLAMACSPSRASLPFPLEWRCYLRKRLFRRDAETSTRDARATRRVFDGRFSTFTLQFA
jgi:hypothetical protein